MSQPPPYGPPPGIPQPYPSPRPRRPGFWARRGLLGKVSVVIGGVLGAFVVLAVLVSALVPNTPARIATKTAMAEARATGSITTATTKEEGRTTATAVSVAAKQGTQDARTTSTAVIVAAKQSTQETQANATANAPTSTPKPVPTEKATGTPKTAPNTAATPIPTALATATTPAPQVVTVKGEPVNLRQAADGGSAVVVLVPPGTDAAVIGADTTGPDGVTRYVYARVGDKEGYLRSDLVSAPHVATPTPVPPTPAPNLYADYPLIDAADWAKRPDYYTNKRFSVIGEAFNVHESKGATTFQMWVDSYTTGKRVAVTVVFNTTSSLQDGYMLRAYGVGKGAVSGTNGFGASISQPLMNAEQIGPPTAASDSAGATAYANNKSATAAALDTDITNLNATGTAIVVDSARGNAASTIRASTTQSFIATNAADATRSHQSSDATITAIGRSVSSTSTAIAQTFAPKATPKP